MYEVSFEVDGKKITKKAKNKGEVRRLVYLYAKGSQSEMESRIKELTELSTEIEVPKVEKINKTKKIEENVNM